ncbi:MAG: S1 RNA-binding domain-containing protein [Anaerolineae bacterium]
MNEEQNSQQSEMWAALESEEYGYQELQRGEIRNGVVIEKTPDRMIVDLGAKTEGIVPADDLAQLGPEAVARIKVGDEVSVYVVRTDGNSGEVIVSLSRARGQQDWNHANDLLNSGEIVEAKVVGQNKGGLIVQLGQLQAFVPRSHIVLESGMGENLAQMVGQTIPIKIIEVDRRQRRLIASERAAWKEWRRGQKERLLDQLAEGAVVKGRVTSITDFGVFVDLGGADGLIHVSELSWDRNVQPKDVLRVGEEVEVYVLNVDRDRNRIGLSLKRLRPDPWSTLAERYQPGELVQGTITNLAKFGAFARIGEGVEGLIHISELADRPVNNPADVVHEGQVVTVKVLGVDTQRKRVSLSLRQAEGETPAQPAAAEATDEVTAEAEAPEAPLAPTAAVETPTAETEPEAGAEEAPDAPTSVTQSVEMSKAEADEAVAPSSEADKE